MFVCSLFSRIWPNKLFLFVVVSAWWSVDVLSWSVIPTKHHQKMSVLYSFYASPDFQDLAQERESEMESSSSSGTLIKMRSAPQSMTTQSLMPSVMDSPHSFLCPIFTDDVHDDFKDFNTASTMDTHGMSTMSPLKSITRRKLDQHRLGIMEEVHHSDSK